MRVLAPAGPITASCNSLCAVFELDPIPWHPPKSTTRLLTPWWSPSWRHALVTRSRHVMPDVAPCVRASDSCCHGC